MKKLHKIFLLFYILLVMTMLCFAFPISAEGSSIVVGVYECAPYYFVDEQGNVTGFYNDLLNLLETKCDFSHTYKIGSFQDNLDWLKDGTVDVVLGISISSERLEHMIYSEQSIITENFGLYSNIGDLEQLKFADSVKVGVVPQSKSAQFISNYFESIGVHANFIEGENWNDLQKLFEQGELDVISHSSASKTDKSLKIYEFIGDQAYIAGNKNSRAILDQFDQAILELHKQSPDPIHQLYNRYFEENTVKQTNRMIVVLVILLLIIGVSIVIPKWRHQKIKNQIKENMLKNNYVLQYQPIYNSVNNTIVGFEALLRLMCDKKMIPPLQFIPDIEKHDMLYDVSLWILQKAMQDYQVIQNYSCMLHKDFYISVNISLNEIENKHFTKKASDLLKQSGLGANKICLEIIERIKMEDLANATQNLQALKEAGFKIAIDDFGTEYSNFDLLLKLDIDVVKVDRSLVNGIDEDSLKKEVVNFISQIARIKNRDVVLEGVEQQREVDTIKAFHNERIFVQGYYYSKPVFKEVLDGTFENKQ